ncbi:MAG: hypothetical protein JXO51_12350 [Candidatus Aminicenantes bacterium]|nr:hypothetical protein [Candidatus Aminicenantes bacterium]
MKAKECAHTWDMAHVAYGYIITEKCSKCQIISTYFTFEDRPPLEEYREGDHFWNVVESAQSFRFDFKCRTCGQVVKFDELMGLLMCTGCDRNCRVAQLQASLEKEKTWIYVAFGFLPKDKHPQLPEEKIAMLEDFFNRRRNTTASRIKILSQDLVADYALCYGKVIKDVNMLCLTLPEEGS